MYVYVCVCMCMYVYVCVCMCMYVYVCVCMCMYVYVCVCMCMYVYVYVYVCNQLSCGLVINSIDHMQGFRRCQYTISELDCWMEVETVSRMLPPVVRRLY